MYIELTILEAIQKHSITIRITNQRNVPRFDLASIFKAPEVNKAKIMIILCKTVFR